jgi:hypothetical protein
MCSAVLINSHERISTFVFNMENLKCFFYCPHSAECTTEDRLHGSLLPPMKSPEIEKVPKKGRPEASK